MTRNIIIGATFLAGVTAGIMLNSISPATAHPEDECAPCVCPPPPVCLPLESQNSEAVKKALQAIQAVEIQAQQQVQTPAE